MKRRSGFTLIELILAAALSSVVVLGLVTGLVVFSGRAVDERSQRQLLSEVELTERWLAGEIKTAVDLPPLSDYADLEVLPGPAALALVVPEGDQFSLVLYCYGLLPEGFPYDDPSFTTRYGNLNGAWYRWQSPPFADPTQPPEPDPGPTEWQMVSAYLQPYDADPNLSGIAFIPAEQERGGLLIISGLRPLDLKGQGANCANATTAQGCRPLTREIYVYSQNMPATELAPPATPEPEAESG